MINKALVKNVCIMDIKLNTYKVLYMQEFRYFWKKTKDKQSCLKSKNFYSLKKTHDKYVYFLERKHKTYKVVYNLKIFASKTKFMTGMYLFWRENKRHTKLYVFWKENKRCTRLKIIA